MIGQKLRTLRQVSGLNQKELAKKAELSQAIISRLESGQVNELKAGALARLARALGVPIHLLVDGFVPDLAVRRDRPLTPDELSAALGLITSAEKLAGGVYVGVLCFRQGAEHVAYLETRTIGGHEKTGYAVEAELAAAFRERGFDVAFPDRGPGGKGRKK